MRLFFPYNEILPKKKAHDVFLFHECVALAKQGLSVSLFIGNGSSEREKLFNHYGCHLEQSLNIFSLPIIRKNNFLNLSWNYPFFALMQQKIKRERPDWVILSVRKQGHYHLSRRVQHVRYLYEVHELTTYPFYELGPEFKNEKGMLQNADLITVTTHALKDILVQPPYSITTPIEVVPLAVKNTSLLNKQKQPSELHLMYIGQLYDGQGIGYLLKAMQLAKGIKLTIIGGKESEINKYIDEAKRLNLNSVQFLGFLSPKDLAFHAQRADAFVAPFENIGRMPYVAHTKVFEYAAWGKPFIAPQLPIVAEHFSEQNGVLLFEAGNPYSLADCMQRMTQDHAFKKLQKGAQQNVNRFTWENRAIKYINLMY